MTVMLIWHFVLHDLQFSTILYINFENDGIQVKLPFQITLFWEVFHLSLALSLILIFLLYPSSWMNFHMKV